VDFDACLSTSSAAIASWAWTIDGAAQPATSDCKLGHDFSQQGTHQVSLKVTDRQGRSATVDHTVEVRDLLVVSIGDSVASGEGDPEKPGAFSPTWTDTRCHRSTLAGPSQAALQLERRDPTTSVTFLSLACSGASVEGPDTAHGGLLTPYAGQQPDSSDEPPLPPQIDVLRDLLRQPDGTYRHIDALFVSIGANDAHFSDVLRSCMYGAPCYTGTTASDFDTRVAALPQHYADLNAAIAGLVDPHDVFMTEYFDPTRDSAGAWDLDCVGAPYSPIDRSEAKWASTYVVPSLNGHVQAAAQQYGWNYVAGPATGFAEHGYCADNRWIVQVGESLSTEGKPDGAFHPNVAGHAFYGERIADAAQPVLTQDESGSDGSGGAGSDSRGDLYLALYNMDGTVQTVPYNVAGFGVSPEPPVVVARGVSTAGGSLRVAASDSTAYAVWTDLTAPTAVNRSFESFGGRGAYSAPNLHALRTEVVQNVDDPTVLIAGKSATVRTQVGNDFPDAKNVDVRVRATIGRRDGSTSEATTDTQVRVPPGTSWVDLPPDRTITVPTDADWYSVTVTLDPGNAIAEAHEDDNTASVLDHVESSRVLKVLYVPAGSIGSIGQCADVTATEDASSAFVTAAFPIADADSRQRAACEAQVTTTKDAGGVDVALSQLDAMARSEGYDAAVGVVPAGWLEAATGTTAAGVALVGSSTTGGVPGGGALVEAGHDGALTAHELGHLFGLDHNSGVPAPGYWPARHQPQDNTTDFMDPQIPARAWISKQTSDALLQRLQWTPGDPAVIEVRGVIAPDGGVNAPAWYRQQGLQDVALDAPGQLTLRYLDGHGTVLATTGINTQASAAAGTANEVSVTGGYEAFDARVPDVAGTAELVLLRGSTILLDRHVTASAPTVHLTAPANGATLTPGQHVTVSWTASDPDGGTLSSQVEVSTDSGATWVPLARDLSGTSYDLTVTRTLQSSHVRFRVITSDGVNTGSAANAADLVVAQPTGNGRIAFTHQTQYGSWPNTTYSGYEAWLMNADGSNQHKLFDGIAPRLWDPAGGSLVSLTGNGIQWYDVDTGAVRTTPATLPPGASGPIGPCPAFSPDGTHLVFTAGSPTSGSALYTIGVDGTGLKLVADNVAGCGSWSPDGSRIAFPEAPAPGTCCYRSSGVATVAPDGTGRTLIDTLHVDIADVSYSPDGQQLALYDASNYRVHVLNADGTGDHKVYPSAGGYTYQVGWSPDGTRLLVEWWDYGYTYMIATMKPDGSDMRALTTDDPNAPGTYRIDRWPSWESLNGTPPRPPVSAAADAGGPYTVAQGQPLTLDASRSATTGDVPAYEWDLDGNGTYGDAAGVAVTTVFHTAGQHTIGVRVTHPDGTVATAQANVAVTPAPPTVTAPAHIDGAIGLPVHLVGVAVTDYGTALPTVAVDWGDGTTTSETLGQLVDVRYNIAAGHQYSAPGTYSITITGAQDGTTGPATTVSATIADDPSPRLTSVNPNEAPASGGTTVRIVGERLATTSRVTVGGADAAYQALGDTALDVTVPAGPVRTAPVVVTTAGGTASATLSYVNTSAPTAMDIHVETEAGQAVSLRLQGAGTGNWLTFATTTAPANGDVDTPMPDVVVYTPRAGFIGTDTMGYVARDANGTSAPATVTIRVGNHPPAVGDSVATGPVGTPLTVRAADLLAHATDVDGDPLAVVGAYVDPSAGADLSFSAATGSITVTRTQPGAVAVDVLVSDGRGDPVHATLTVTFTANLPEVVGLSAVSLTGPRAAIDTLDSTPAEVLSNERVKIDGGRVDGNVTSTQGSVTLEKRTVVTGTVKAATSITDHSGNANADSPNTPTTPLAAHAVPACGPPYRAAPTAADPWITGAYRYDASTGDLKIDGHKSATITAAGTYCLREVEVSGGATLTIAAGPVVMQLTGQFSVSGGSSVNAAGPAAGLKVSTSSTHKDSVSISGGSAVHALVYAPGAELSVTGGSSLTGAALGDALEISGNSSLHCDATPPALSAWWSYLTNGT
jgi:hypothetical protein